MIAVITIPNRTIKHGEYGASFGCMDTHKDVLMKHLFRMEISSEEIQGESLTLTLTKQGKLGKRNTEEIWYLWQKGFITAISY